MLRVASQMFLVIFASMTDAGPQHTVPEKFGFSVEVR